MSQQGPGGYGGPPPGGHGGWGPPGSGYGGPPGGGAPPGGHPPQWGQPPGYSPQGAPPPGVPGGPQPPAKKTNMSLLLGLGCAGLLLLSAAGAAGFYFFVMKPAQEVQKALEAAGATVSLSDGGIVVQGPGGLTANVTDGGIVVQAPGTPAVPLNSLGAGGPACEQAAACCKKIAEKTGAAASALAACNQFQSLPAIGCQQALEAYKRSAAGVGATCP